VLECGTTYLDTLDMPFEQQAMKRDAVYSRSLMLQGVPDLLRKIFQHEGSWPYAISQLAPAMIAIQ
jgi:hypothetical protein